MSFDNGSYNTFSAEAAADLTGKQYHAVKINSSGKLAVAAAGQFAVGILQNKPAAGQPGNFLYAGISKVVLGGTVAAGATVAVNANGQIVDATEATTNTADAGGAADALVGSNVIGVALAGGAAGELVPVLVTHSGAAPTTAA